MDKLSEPNAIPKTVPASEIYEPFQKLDLSRIALESTNIGIWIIDLTTRIFLPFRYTKELFGCEIKKEMSFDGAMWINHVILPPLRQFQFDHFFS